MWLTKDSFWGGRRNETPPPILLARLACTFNLFSFQPAIIHRRFPPCHPSEQQSDSDLYLVAACIRGRIWPNQATVELSSLAIALSSSDLHPHGAYVVAEVMHNMTRRHQI